MEQCYVGIKRHSMSSGIVFCDTNHCSDLDEQYMWLALFNLENEHV